MEKLIYVSGNEGKLISVQEKFKNKNLDIEIFKYDLDELNINDIKLISEKKAKDAYEIVKCPCFVADSGFYIDAYPNNPGYPGAFAKRSGVANNIEELLETLKDVHNRKCRFIDCLTFYNGEEIRQFFGVSEGTLTYEKRGIESKKKKSNLWYLFVPNNCDKTLAEMNDEERNNRNDGRTSATDIFIDWYKNEYTQIKKLRK